MNCLLLLIAPGIGAGLLLGAEPLVVLRYVGAAIAFAYARELAACPACGLSMNTEVSV